LQSKKVVLLAMVLIVLLLFTSCSTTQSQGNDEHVLSFLDVSKYPDNVYIGISGPYSTKERMVEEALISAARSIHLRQALAMDSRLVMSYRSDKGLQSFAVEEAAYYDDTALAKTIASLKVLSLHFDDKAGAVVVVQDPRQEEKERIYKSVYDAQGKPTWLGELPKIEGYQFGIGSTKRYYFLNDTLEAADFSAAQNLLDLKTAHALVKEKVTVEDQLLKRDLYQAQRGLLSGFTILARFYDSETQTYWSLASCLQ
jgi:hypothetical protein